MCFILITLNNEGKETESPEIIAQKEISNPHGTSIFTPHDKKINRALAASEEAIERTRNAKMTIAHMRFATTGNVSQQNTHLWQKKGAYFAHNGIVTKYSSYSIQAPGKKVEHKPTDSYLFFKSVEEFIEADEVDTVAVSKEAAEAGVGGRFLISTQNKTYLFGDWEVTALEGVTYITSAGINLSNVVYQNGIPFVVKENALETDIKGVYVIDHETLLVKYLHQNKEKTYAKQPIVGFTPGYQHKQYSEHYNYDYGDIDVIPMHGARSKSKFND